MKNMKYNYSIILLVAMLLVGAAVVALLAGSAVSTAKKASNLSDAVLLAASASDMYYEASNSTEHHEMLKMLECPDGLSVSVKYEEKGTLQFAIIDIISDGNTIYSFTCEKYVAEEQ